MADPMHRLLTSAGIFATTFMRRFNQQSTEQVSLLQSVDVSDTLHSGRKGGLAEALKAAIVRPVFWLLLCNVFLLGGAGSFHLWNVGNLIHSIEGGSQAASTSSAILLSAASQGTSRLLVAASDRVAVRRLDPLLVHADDCEHDVSIGLVEDGYLQSSA